MILTTKYSCGEVKEREVKDCEPWKREAYFDACVGGTTKNSKGDFVVIVHIQYGDMARGI